MDTAPHAKLENMGLIVKMNVALRDRISTMDSTMIDIHVDFMTHIQLTRMVIPLTYTGISQECARAVATLLANIVNPAQTGKNELIVREWPVRPLRRRATQANADRVRIIFTNHSTLLHHAFSVRHVWMESMSIGVVRQLRIATVEHATQHVILVFGIR